MNVLSLLSRTHPSHMVLFDVGSATIGVAVAKYHSGHPIEILFTHREHIKYADGTNVSDALRVAIINAGKSVLEALGTLGHRRIGSYSVQAVVHAPWIDSYSTRIESGLKEEVAISRALLQKFMHDRLPKTSPPGRVQCDYHVTKIELNGYHTLDPFQKTARHIALTVLQSTVAEKVHEALRSAYSSVFPNHEVHIDSFLFAITQLQDAVAEHDSFSVLDVGGEYTTLHIIQDGVAMGGVGIDFGTEHLLRAIMKGTNLDRHAALSELTMYLAKTCTPSQCSKIENSLKQMEIEWAQQFGDACTTLSKTRRIPNALSLFGDTRLTQWFTHILTRFEFATFTTTGQVFVATPLSFNNAQQEVVFHESAKTDNVLALLALFVDK